jgi:hypothetical protein
VVSYFLSAHLRGLHLFLCATHQHTSYRVYSYLCDSVRKTWQVRIVRQVRTYKLEAEGYDTWPPSRQTGTQGLQFCPLCLGFSQEHKLVLQVRSKSKPSFLYLLFFLDTFSLMYALGSITPFPCFFFCAIE